MYTVYTITNQINSRVYVGCTKNFFTRMCDHLHGSQNPDLCKDIERYGSENFLVEKVHTCELRSEALRVERDYIRKFEFVYNEKQTTDKTLERYKLEESEVFKSTDVLNTFEYSCYDCGGQLIKEQEKISGLCFDCNNADSFFTIGGL